MADSIIPAAPLPTPSLPPSPAVIPPAALPPPSPNLPQNPVVGTSPGGPGVLGESNIGAGVYGQSLGQRTGPTPNWLPAGDGVLGEGRTGVHGRSTAGGDGVHGESPGGFGVRGDSPQGFAAVHGNGGKNGVWGYTVSANDAGVFGSNDGSGNGVTGYSKNGGFGVRGDSPQGIAAVHGNGGKNGVWGYTVSANDAGVFGSNDGSGNGVTGYSKNGGFGVRGDSPQGIAAVHGNGGRNGVWGYTTSKTDSGVFGSNDGDGGNGVAGYSKNGIGVLGWSDTGLAGLFNGHVTINGNLTMGNNGDCVFADFAEDFDVARADFEPGTVMVIDQDGNLRPCHLIYDKRVAGVISGGGNFRPGIVLGKQSSEANRAPIALVGKVYCKVDASYSRIEIGDLLTTSPTPGNAMKVIEPMKAFGAVIGKALRPFDKGQGLIPILIALQ